MYLVHFANHNLFGHTTFFPTKEAAQTFFRAVLIMTILNGNINDARRGPLEEMGDGALYELHKAKGGLHGVCKPAVSMSATTLDEYYEMLSRCCGVGFNQEAALMNPTTPQEASTPI